MNCPGVGSEFLSNDAIFCMRFYEIAALHVIFLGIVIPREADPTHSLVGHVLTCTEPVPRSGAYGPAERDRAAPSAVVKVQRTQRSYFPPRR